MAANMRLLCRRFSLPFSGVHSQPRPSLTSQINWFSTVESLKHTTEDTSRGTSDDNRGLDILDVPDYFHVNEMFTLKEMFNAGVHLGHHEGCWNPLMRSYLYGTLHHHHIIDLNQSLIHMQRACNVLAHIAYRKGIILFVNTHPKFEKITQTTARESGEYFIARKWRGGTLSNMQMILGASTLPHCMVFLHQPTLGRNLLPIKEANMMNIPTIGIVDSDCDPRLIMYPIPGNDDTPKTMEFYCDVFKKVILTAKKRRKEDLSADMFS